MRVPLQRVKSCKFCTDFKGQPKPIMPENLYRAKRMPDGSYKCETCQVEELKDRIVRVTPNSIRAREIIEERTTKQKKDSEFKRREAMIKNMPGERFTFRQGVNIDQFPQGNFWV